MKFQVTFKSPDAVSYKISNLIEEELDNLNLEEDELNAIREIRIQKLSEKVGKWFKHLEYVTIEIDTEKDTAMVVKQ